MKRGEQRRYAILGALHEHGEMNTTELCKILHFNPGYIYADMALLEERDGLIVHRMAVKDGDGGRRMYWRIADDEQRRSHRRRQLDDEPVVSAPRRRMPLGTLWQPGGAS